MATLEKIRSKSVLLLVIIAVALLAFILGDFLTSGRSFFGSGTTIAKVDGHSIDVQEFQRRLEEANQTAQQQGRKLDSSVLQQQVLQEMIAEQLFNEEMDRLGIKVTDQELSDAMLGENSAYFNQMIQQQYGIESAAQLHDMAFNPQKYQLDAEQAAQLRNIWLKLEKDTEQGLRSQKFQTLFMGTLVANDLDAKSLYDDNAQTSHIAIAKKDYSTLEDAKYEVTDADIEAAWKERQNRYKIDEQSRLVDYIAVDITPSAADLQASQKKVEEALAALRDKEGTTGLENMNEFVVDRKSMTRSDLRGAMKSFVDSASTGKVAIVSRSGNDYTIAKLLGSTAEVDSVNIDFMQVAGSRAQIDSLISQLNSGAKFEEVAKNPIVEGSQDSVWVALVNPNYAQLRPTFENAELGRYFTPDTTAQDRGRIFRVRTRRAPVTVYDVAEINYVAEPSAATVNNLLSDLDKFLAANTTAADFAKNAAKAGYNVQTAMVSASSARLGQLDDSHAAVAWALDAKKGQVSPVFGDQASERYIAVALENIYDDFIPASDPSVRDELTQRVRNQKKGDALVKQFSGKAKDVAGYARLFGTQADTTTVTFGSPSIQKIGFNESTVTSEVASAKPGQLVGPVKGNSAVVVFAVTNVDKNQRPFNVEESSVMFMQTRGAGVLSRNIFGILKGNKKVENKLSTFYK